MISSLVETLSCCIAEARQWVRLRRWPVTVRLPQDLYRDLARETGRDPDLDEIILKGCRVKVWY